MDEARPTRYRITELDRLRGYMISTPRRLFIALGVVSAVAVIGFRTQSLWLDRSRLLEQREAQAASQAQLAATFTARLYDGSARLLDETLAYIQANQPSPEALREHLAKRAEETSPDDYVVVLDRQGSIVALSE